MEVTACRLVARLRDAGHVAYFAGGCVRDLVRGDTPKDFDIATSARPEEVQRIFSELTPSARTLVSSSCSKMLFSTEVATFRSDGAYLDGRRPVAVHFSSAEEDARRRDFTINGMFFDPVADEVIDFVGAAPISTRE